MMFTRSARIDVDVVEKSFVDYKNEFGEKSEDLIQKILVDKISVPPLVDDDIEIASQLYGLGPWGYSFRITKSLTAYQLDQLTFPRLIGKHDSGLDEMDLRISILNQIFKKYYLSGDRWLDIATNCGIIPILLNKNRSMNVTGIDLAVENIAKANALAAIGNSSNISFSQADAYDFLDKCGKDSFEIISALGIFYHLSDRIGLMNKIYNSTKRIAIVDTIAHNFPFSGWIQTISRHTKYEHLGHANDTRKIVELHPTYRGLIDTFFQVGFDEVIQFEPSDALLLACPSAIYRDKNRVILVGIKSR